MPLPFKTCRPSKEEEKVAYIPLKELSTEIDLLRIITDSTTYWTQIVITLAIAIERYILIVTGVRSKTLLSSRRRLCFYAITVFFGCCIPMLYIADFLVHTYKLNNPSLERNQPLPKVRLEDEAGK